MADPSKNRFRKKSSGSRVAAVAVAVLIIGAIAGYFMFSPSPKSPVPPQQRHSEGGKPGLPAVVPAAPPSAVPPAAAPPAHKEPESVRAPASGTAAEVEAGSPQLAIIIDDMGSSLPEARSLAAINVPLTFAIIPELRSDKEVAAFAASRKIETMIHIPMQSKGWPARRLEANGLLVGMDADEIRARVTRFVQRFPGAVGVNNHMGSEFTEQEDQMTTVLQILKNNDLFFIDSITSPHSAGGRVAQRLGVRTARRNVFLDNEQERGYILGQLNQAVKQARKNGSAIAICHPHPATIAALAAALPELAGQGVRLVPASQLVR